tara:strand:+ start:281 stop:409 length:129 start_codon:yes stop_codon:yes gene_type:complete
VPEVQSPVWSAPTLNEKVNNPNISNGPINPKFMSPLVISIPI